MTSSIERIASSTHCSTKTPAANSCSAWRNMIPYRIGTNPPFGMANPQNATRTENNQGRRTIPPTGARFHLYSRRCLHAIFPEQWYTLKDSPIAGVPANSSVEDLKNVREPKPSGGAVGRRRSSTRLLCDDATRKMFLDLYPQISALCCPPRARFPEAVSEPGGTRRIQRTHHRAYRVDRGLLLC